MPENEILPKSPLPSSRLSSAIPPSQSPSSSPSVRPHRRNNSAQSISIFSPDPSFSGDCFDLLDIRYTRELAEAAAGLERRLGVQGISLPENQSVSTGDYDWLKRHRDCFVLNATIPAIGHRLGTSFQTARGVFQEGEPAFTGAGIKLKSHIQIAVRDARAIIGYFRPPTH